MSNWIEPLAAANRGVPALSGYYQTVTGGSANVKGSWAELSSSLPYAASAAILTFGHLTGSTLGSSLFDLGLGGSGSEVVVVADLPHVPSSTGNPYRMTSVALAFPMVTGQRIAARVQSTWASASYRANLVPLRGGVGKIRRATTYGTTGASSKGTVVTAGTANTKGSYAQLTGSTTNPIRFLALGIGGNTAQKTSANWLIDIAIGAGGSEQVIVSNLPMRVNSNPDDPEPNITPLLRCSIPAGSRLAARAQSSAASEAIDVSAYGFD